MAKYDDSWVPHKLVKSSGKGTRPGCVCVCNIIKARGYTNSCTHCHPHTWAIYNYHLHENCLVKGAIGKHLYSINGHIGERLWQRRKDSVSLMVQTNWTSEMVSLLLLHCVLHQRGQGKLWKEFKSNDAGIVNFCSAVTPTYVWLLRNKAQRDELCHLGLIFIP